MNYYQVMVANKIQYIWASSTREAIDLAQERWGAYPNTVDLIKSGEAS